MAGIGEFTNLVELTKAGPTPDDPEGGYDRTWQALDPATWYCSITPATSRDLERVSGGAVTQTATHLIRGRYHPQIAADCRITFRGRIFEVASVHNPDEEQIELTIIATELIGVVPAAIIPQPPAAHAPTHQPGGTDPIGPQPPAVHAATHAAGGTDPIPPAVLPADVAIAGSLAIGTNPATTGQLRLTGAGGKVISASSTEGDVDLVRGDDQRNVTIGGANTYTWIASGLYPIRTTAPIQITDHAAIGTNPAQSGALRLANDQAVKWRTSDNALDIPVVWFDDSLKFQTYGGSGFFFNGGGRAYFSGGVNSTDVAATDHVKVGTNPAQSGALRLAGGGTVVTRNTSNTVDHPLIGSNGAGSITVGSSVTATYLDGTAVNCRAPLLLAANSVHLAERAAPTAPAANNANLWLQDSGAGKSQLMIQFNTGAPIAIVTQV